MSFFSSTTKSGLIVRVVFCISLVTFLVTFFIKDSETSNIQEDTIATGITKTNNDSREFDPTLLNISISSDIFIDNVTYTGAANIMNIKNENEIIKVNITLDETGESIYQSPFISTEEMIEVIEISKQLDVGTHKATATFDAYSKDTNDYLTSVVVDINLTIVKSI